MVKADIKRDYYADLELPSTADVDEIKKQFRLLGRVACFLLDVGVTYRAQRNSITPIAIPAMKSKLYPSSRQCRPPMRFLSIQ